MAVVAFSRSVAVPQETSTPYTPSEQGSPHERRLRAFGRILKIIFAVYAAVLIIVTLGTDLTLFLHFRRVFVSGYYNGYLSFFVWSPLDYVNPDLMGRRFIPYDFPLREALKILPILATAQIPGLVFAWSLFRLFSLYAKGLVFDRKNTTAMQRTGLAMVSISCIPFWYVPAMRCFGLSPRWFILTDTQIGFFMLGLIMLAIAHVMEIGRVIQQEQSEIL